MPRASRRLSILLLPAHPDADATTPDTRALERLGARFVRAAEVRFLACGGGFAVRCPRDDQSVIPAFQSALATWRGGGPRVVACPCGESHDLAALRYLPAAGFARAWIEVPDADGSVPEPELLALAQGSFGAVRVVLRRG